MINYYGRVARDINDNTTPLQLTANVSQIIDEWDI